MCAARPDSARPDLASRMGVPARPDLASRIGVPARPELASRIGVPNWARFSPSRIGGSSASRMSYLLRYRFGGGVVYGVYSSASRLGGGPKQSIPARPEWGPFPWLLIRRGPGKLAFGGLWGFWGGCGCKFGSFWQFFRIWGISPPRESPEMEGGGVQKGP